MTPTLAAAASGNLDAFSGARVSGTVPVREELVREATRDAVGRHRGRVQDVDIRFRPNNVLECGVRISVGPFSKWFRPRMILSPDLLTPTGPTVVLTVASSEYLGLMWIAQIFAAEFFPRGFMIDGRQIRIQLAILPQLADARPFLRYMRGLRARTAAGLLFLDFDLQVNE